MKFKYNYLENRLWKIEEEYTSEISENNQFRTEGFYNGVGFILSPDNHWITFTIYPDKIRAFYKQVNKCGEITYYQKDSYFTRELSPYELEKTVYPGKIELEFTARDIVVKENDKWVRKKE